MSSSPKLQSSSFLRSLSHGIRPSLTSCPARETKKGDLARNRLFGSIRPIFELLGFSFFLRRSVDLWFLTRSSICRSDKRQHSTKLLLKRTLFLVFWLWGWLAVGFASGLIAVSRIMFEFGSRLYNAAARIGLGTSSQQANRFRNDSACSINVLQDRLEIANLAVKQLKSEGLALQEKLKAAGERITRLETTHGECTAFNALQTKYAEVSAEIVRLTTENKKLKDDAARLVKENVDLRQCLAMKTPDMKDEDDGLGMLARLQNQQLDSCIFPRDDDTPMKNMKQEVTYDLSEDSIVFVTGADTPKNKFDCSGEACTAVAVSVGVKTEVHPSHSLFSDDTKVLTVPAFRTGRAAPELPMTVGSSPIPVFTTVRPSLPPKLPKLKPLLLATRLRAPGIRRNSIKQARLRKSSIKQQEKKAGNDGEKENYSKAGSDSHSYAKELNPQAPAFTPRIAVVAPAHVSSCLPNTNEVTSSPRTVKPQSPAFSPFIFSSPSPNSPFLRPAPPRRQSEDAPFPTLTTTPATPTTPVQFSQTGDYSSGGGTPRSTRASSVRLIRVRAAMRNSQRVASGSDAIPSDSPLGFKMASSMGTMGVKADATHAKLRLVGKGVPPRRALGEVSNSDDNIATARWTSV